jgi:hypothetical protein
VMLPEYAPVVPDTTRVLFEVVGVPEPVIYAKPRWVTVAPPSLVTLPFAVNCAVWIEVAALVVTLGALACPTRFGIFRP